MLHQLTVPDFWMPNRLYGYVMNKGSTCSLLSAIFSENNHDPGILFTNSNEAAYDDVILHMYFLQTM